jgi:hypothetical protein
MAIVPNPDSVGSEQHQLDNIPTRFDSAIGPDLNPAPKPGSSQRQMGLLNPYLNRHANVPQGVFPGGPCSTVIAANRDDVGVSLGNSGSQLDQ